MSIFRAESRWFSCGDSAKPRAASRLQNLRWLCTRTLNACSALSRAQRLRPWELAHFHAGQKVPAKITEYGGLGEAFDAGCPEIPGRAPSHRGLEVLLSRIEAQTLILTGFAGDICVLFTANDAYMRGFDVIVPADGIASERAEDNAHALRQMARILKADISKSEDLNLGRCRASTRPKQSA